VSLCFRSALLSLALSGVAWAGQPARSAPPPKPARPIDGLATLDEGWAVSLPGRAVRSVTIEQSWANIGALAFTFRSDPPPSRPLRVMVSLVAWDGWWYQSAELASIAGTKPHKLTFDLGHLSNDWSPRGHLRPWDGYVRQQVEALSISVFSPVPYAGTVHISGVELSPRRTEDKDELFLYDAEVLTDLPRAGSPVTVSFRLSKPYGNPFELDLMTVSVMDGDREVSAAPAYFYQGFRRTRRELLMPVGEPCWRAELMVPKPGAYTWCARARDGKEVVRLEAGRLTAGPAGPEPPPGEEVKLTAEELMPFTLPRRVGRTAPVFRLVKGKWTFGQESHKQPLLRAWRVPLEWTARWGRYQGLGRYNLETAWEFDQLLSKADAAGVSLPLALNATEAFQGQGRYNWFSNPLAAHMGGPLSAPSRYFTDKTAEKFFQRRVGYLAARWGRSAAVSRFELWMSVPANFAEAWHARAGAFLAAAPLCGKPVVSRHPQGAMLGKRRRIAGFDQPWAGWRAASRISPRTRVELVSAPVSRGGKSLKAHVGFPGEAAVYSDIRQNWNGYGRLAFDVYVPKDAPNDMRAMVYVREHDWWWYETLLAPLLRPGDWTKLIVDISPDSPVWKPRSHRRVWDGYVAQSIRQMGVRIFGQRKYDGPVYIDNIELWPDPLQGGRLAATELTANRDKVGQHEKFELTFRLSRVFKNPFDPAEADVRGHFVSPGGRHVEVPAFFHQGYERKLAGGTERLTAVGRSGWKVRFAARDIGTWSCYVKVNGKVVENTTTRFQVVASRNPGYVRRSRTDPLYLEFTNGQFFYPIGHTLRSPSDGRRPYAYRFQTPEGKGTYIYDAYFKKMAAAGENMARIWMCSWWCGLEWNERWHGFAGIGRYNMENAWRLDHLVEQAGKHGIYIALDTTNHGQYSTDIDHEWENNPYNKVNGGFLKRARDFFKNDRAKQKYKDRMRYTIARWGYSTSVMMWTLFSEVEFVEEYWQYNRHGPSYCSPHVAPWHGAMARYIKAVDPFGHLVTTHVSHPWRGHDVWARPELELLQSNAYSKYPELGQVDIVATLSKIYHDKLKQFRRPLIVAEYGGHWMANTAKFLDAELHSGLWATAMMPYAGNTGFWWWLHIHFADKYSHYRALANFMKGEDRRGKNYIQGNYLVTSPGDVLKAVGLQNRTSARVWVYHSRVPVSLKPVQVVQGARLAFAGLQNGVYRIDLWDTYKGAKTGTLRAQSVSGQMTLKLPTVRNDLALKVFLEKADRPSPKH